MNNEILFVDDDTFSIEVYSYLLTRKGYHVSEYSDFDKALEYVQALQKSPVYSFVDMKPLSLLEIGRSLSEEQKRILTLPEKIFECFKSKSWERGFYFITGGTSSHNRQVLNRTGANCLGKPSLFNFISESLPSI